MARSRSEASDDWVLSRLSAIAFPNRLELIRLLGQPRPIDEIDLHPAMGDEDRQDRVLTRQGIQYHLRQLREAGLLEARRIKDNGQSKNEYHVNRAEVYALSEALRRMVQGREGDEIPSPGEPATMPWLKTRGNASLPRLTVVHGAEIGHRFPLEPDHPTGRRGWVIGRSRDAQICIPEDPYLADQAAEIEPREDAYHLVDLRSAPARPTLNGAELELGASVQLERGDVIGVGSTLLHFLA